MAREKGMGNLQQEKSGRWTLRIGYNGQRISRTTGTCDRDKAEKMMMRILAPLGRGEKRLPLADVWCAYLRSPNRRDLAQATLESKQMVWMQFARWMENAHIEIGSLAEVTADSIAEYLAEFKLNHTAATYNNRVCILREIFHVLADKGGLIDDPWQGVRLRPEDSHTRRELTLDELSRLLAAAGRVGVPSSTSHSNPQTSQHTNNVSEWHTLFLIGIYTGLRLGDCCQLKWDSVNLDHGIIQVIPAKTAKHAHGRPVTIPIHPVLDSALRDMATMQHGEASQPAAAAKQSNTPSPYVLPTIAATYRAARWRISEQIAVIFRSANIEMHEEVEGRTRLATVASFHSLRHTFVSFAANAGIPLAVVQSIVGHSTSLMTRHYYHESETALKAAVASIPVLNM